MRSGLLARAPQLDVWLHASVVVLTLASTGRYLAGHGLGDRAVPILACAVVLLGAYAAQPRSSRPGWLRPAWCLLVVALWVALAVLAPSFSWVAVPLAFVVLRVFAAPVAVPVLAVMVLTVVATWSGMRGEVDPTVVAGPVCIAVLAVVAYWTLEREASTRQRLLDDLEAAQGDLAAAQHRAGALAERGRLSRDLHDSVAQGLSSINLLLQAAEQDWSARPDAARTHVAQAALAARDGLDEVRRVVHDLAADDPDGSGDLLAALRVTVDRVPGLTTGLHVYGDPVPVPADLVTALVHTARGALANVAEHAGVDRAAVTVTFQPGEVSLDVVDAGRGFAPAQGPTGERRGRGLAGLRRRAETLGGTFALETAPGEGTVVAVSFPLPAPTQEPA